MSKGGRLKLVAVLSVLAAMLNVPVLAQTPQSGNGFRISPVRSEYTIERGKTQTLIVTIENPTNIPTTAVGVVNDFVASDQEDGQPRLVLDDKVPAPKKSFKKLVPQISNVQLGPKEKKDVPIVISVPEDAAAGGYYGAIRYLPSVTNNAGNVGLTASVGTIVLVRVPGDLTEKLDLIQLSALQNHKPKSFLTSGEVQALTRIKNSGDVHLQPFGKVQIKNMLGKVVAEQEINSTTPRANILPESIRRFETDMKRPSGGWIGRYTITANIGYSQGSGELLTGSASFWYMPVWSLIALAILIVAIVGGVYWFIVRRQTRTHRRQ